MTRNLEDSPARWKFYTKIFKKNSGIDGKLEILSMNSTRASYSSKIFVFPTEKRTSAEKFGSDGRTDGRKPNTTINSSGENCSDIIRQRAKILKMKTKKTDDLLNQPKEKFILMRKMSYTIFLNFFQRWKSNSSIRYTVYRSAKIGTLVCTDKQSCKFAELSFFERASSSAQRNFEAYEGGHLHVCLNYQIFALIKN